IVGLGFFAGKEYFDQRAAKVGISGRDLQYLEPPQLQLPRSHTVVAHIRPDFHSPRSEGSAVCAEIRLLSPALGVGKGPTPTGFSPGSSGIREAGSAATRESAPRTAQAHPRPH